MFSLPVLPLVLAPIEVVEGSILEIFWSFWEIKILFMQELWVGFLQFNMLRGLVLQDFHLRLFLLCFVKILLMMVWSL